MKIIQNIIEELIQPEKSLTSPLLKAKVLATRIQNNTLLEWINNELNGYKPLMNDEFKKVPSYREHGANLVGSYINRQIPYDNLPLPTSGLDEATEKYLRSMTMYEDVAELEVMASTTKMEKIGKIIPPELCTIIQKNIRKSNPTFNLISAHKIVSATVVVKTLTTIRSTFLDFMLELDKQFGELTDLNELRQKSELITTIMNHTIINNSGDGALINTGNKAVIDNHVEIKKGNFAGLARTLAENGVPQQDIEELQNVIDYEIPNSETGVFSDRVNSWISKMINKCLDGSWQISIGAAGGMLGDAIAT